MPYASENRLMVPIVKDDQVNQAIISAPGVGQRLAIDYLILNPSGGANVITLTGSSAIGFSRADNQELILENSFHNPTGVFLMNDNQAFSLDLSAATQVEGYVIYRIIGR